MINKLKDAIEGINSSGKCTFRLVYQFTNKVSSWSRYIIFPSTEYLEVDHPVHYSEIDAIDLECIVEKKIGRLMPSKFENNVNEIASFLTKNGIRYQHLDSGVIRIKIIENKDSSSFGSVTI
jgi:hypothetical protein